MMMNEAQSRWTIGIVAAIGGLFGLYFTLMVSYFTDSLPQGLTPLLLLSRITPLYLGGIGALELCWFARWSALSTL
jgi:hypothetical protein